MTDGDRQAPWTRRSGVPCKDDAVDKAELLGRIRQAKAELDEVTAAIPDERMVAPGPDGTWSGKDQLSHLAAWHEILLSRIRGEREEDVLGIDTGRYAAMDVDAVNVVLHERDARMSPSEARDAFERAYRDVVVAVEALDESELSRRFRPDVHDRELLEAVTGDTYEHYEEHLPMLRLLATNPRRT